MEAIQLVTYAAVAIGLVAITVKVFRYATVPESMRWELYPVPHEKGRAEYGGSYLEELDWWTKPRKKDMLNELKEMAQEILLLKGIFHHNKTVWTWSLPFHLGMYIGIGWLVLLIAGAILTITGNEVSQAAGGIGSLLHYATMILGYTAMVLTGIGALGLFFWRLGSKQQRGYSAPIEFFNLLFFDAVVVVALVCHFTVDPGFAVLRGYFVSLITFTPAGELAGWMQAEIILGSVLLAYIPLTRMSHFVAKYFIYHNVRWNDEPNVKGGKIEAQIIKSLSRKVGWSAPHIQTGKTWGEVVTEEPENEQ
ncbi:MAG: nitrate reductase gamma subunit [candidate division Zixibacteria bacterium]|nr:nitrate reductase gamma subunit [candidate division Zixibacteria bacterium]